MALRDCSTFIQLSKCTVCFTYLDKVCFCETEWLMCSDKMFLGDTICLNLNFRSTCTCDYKRVVPSSAFEEKEMRSHRQWNREKGKGAWNYYTHWLNYASHNEGLMAFCWKTWEKTFEGCLCCLQWTLHEPWTLSSSFCHNLLAEYVKTIHYIKYTASNISSALQIHFSGGNSHPDFRKPNWRNVWSA